MLNLPVRSKMTRNTIILVLTFCLSVCSFSETKRPSPPAKQPTRDPLSVDRRFQPLDAIIEDVIAKQQIPGAVLLVGQKGRVIYRKAYGHRALVPALEPMTVDTIFDIASLTKCVATSTSIMRMLELGQLRLNDPVGKFIPEFGTNGKEEITIRELLTHYSGLRPDLDLKQPWSGRDTAFKMITAEKPIVTPGTQFLYSDINFEILGLLIERISGLTEDKYASVHVFQPLKMKHTTYLPPEKWLKTIAPTEYDEHHVILRGVVHDPTARRMGGVAGHAGVFS
jgi:CubicO group peptidase (beta-lactamase class C family)